MLITGALPSFQLQIGVRARSIIGFPISQMRVCACPPDNDLDQASTRLRGAISYMQNTLRQGCRSRITEYIPPQTDVTLS